VDRSSGYAAGIFELAQAEGELERVERELFTIARTLETSTELRDTLTNPQLPVERKQNILEDLVGGRASELTAGLISFIVSQGRGSELPEIVDAFVAKAAASRERMVAQVRSAVELEPEAVERLTIALSRIAGRAVEAKIIVDPSVIGGIVAQVGDMVIDGSIASRLDSLRQALATN
jgi:F-type H+-transporting ATPase subunit delta